MRLTTDQHNVSGAVTCVGVKGNVASIGVALQGTLPGGTTALVIHTASTAEGYRTIDIVPVEPPLRSAHSPRRGTLLYTGTIVVSDAQSSRP